MPSVVKSVNNNAQSLYTNSSMCKVRSDDQPFINENSEANYQNGGETLHRRHGSLDILASPQTNTKGSQIFQSKKVVQMPMMPTSLIAS